MVQVDEKKKTVNQDIQKDLNLKKTQLELLLKESAPRESLHQCIENFDAASDVVDAMTIWHPNNRSVIMVCCKVMMAKMNNFSKEYVRAGITKSLMIAIRKYADDHDLLIHLLITLAVLTVHNCENINFPGGSFDLLVAIFKRNITVKNINIRFWPVLANISADDKNREQLHKAGILEYVQKTLVKGFADMDFDLISLVLRSLINIATSDVNNDYNSVAAPDIVEIIISIMEAFIGYEDVCANACANIINLFNNDENRTIMVQHNCVAKLDNILNKYQNINEGYGDTLTQIITFLKMTPEQIEKYQKVDIDQLPQDQVNNNTTDIIDIDTCISKLEQGYSNYMETIVAMQACPDDPNTQIPGLRRILNLLLDRQNLRYFSEICRDTVGVVVTALNKYPKLEAVQMLGLASVSNLSFEEKYGIAFIEQNMHQKALQSLSECKYESQDMFAKGFCELLSTLSLWDSNSKLYEEGMFQKLFQLMEKYPRDNQLQIYGCTAIVNYTAIDNKKKEHRILLQESGAREIFIKAVQFVRSSPQFLSVWRNAKNLFGDGLEKDSFYCTAKKLMDESGLGETYDMDYRASYFSDVKKNNDNTNNEKSNPSSKEQKESNNND